MAATTTTSQARTPAPVGSTTSRGAPSTLPPAASPAAADACSAVMLGVVPTVRPGKTRPRTPVTLIASVFAPEPRPEKTRVASRTGTSPTACVARVVVTCGTVSVSGSSKRSTDGSTPYSAGPCSAMKADGSPGHDPPDRSLRNPVTSSCRPVQPVCVSSRNRSMPFCSAAIRARTSPDAAPPPSLPWWVWTHVSETTSVTGFVSSSAPSIVVWHPVKSRASAATAGTIHLRRSERRPRRRAGRCSRGRNVMAVRWSGLRCPVVNDPSGHAER